ncbi:methyltransferase domain-containing protein [archaeon]|nr:methyltransferase domain-containing protein [archaeon]
MAKDHSLEEVCRRLGPIDPVIARIIQEKGVANVLEIGCGYGVAMHQLKVMFHEKMMIGGVNLKPHHGDSAFGCAAALDDHLITDLDVIYLEKHNMLPVYVHGDAGIMLPMPDGCVDKAGKKLSMPDDRLDFAYSICAVPFFNDKMHFLEELNRVLRDDGLARIDFRTHDPELGEDGVFLEILRSDGSLIPFEEFIKAYGSLKLTRSPKGFQYLEMRKAEKLDFGLELAGATDLSESNPKLWGVRSTYRVKAGSYSIDVTVE